MYNILNIANGTLIDGKKISPNVSTKLKEDSRVSFGDSKKYLLVKGSIKSIYQFIIDYRREDTQIKEKRTIKKESNSPEKKIKSRSREKVNLSSNTIFNNNSYYSKQNKKVQSFNLKKSPGKQIM